MNRRTFLKLAPISTLALVAACNSTSNDVTPVPATPSPEAPAPELAARRFLELWHANDFNGMYDLLSAEAQTTITRDAFEARYRGVLAQATVYEFETSLVAAGRLDARRAAAEFDLIYRTRLVEDLSFRPRIEMTLAEEGEWKIAWTPALIIPELGDANRLRLFPRTSTRGVVYDRNGEVLATQGTIVTLGVVPGQVEDPGAVEGLISELSGLPSNEIAEKYVGQPDDWFIPVADVAFETSQANYDRLINTPGISLREQATREYPQGELGIASCGLCRTSECR